MDLWDIKHSKNEEAMTTQIRPTKDFDIATHQGQMRIYKKERNQDPQIIVLTKSEQEQVKRVLDRQ